MQTGHAADIAERPSLTLCKNSRRYNRTRNFRLYGHAESKKTQKFVYDFGDVRVATLALLTLTALSGYRCCGVVIANFRAKPSPCEAP